MIGTVRVTGADSPKCGGKNHTGRKKKTPVTSSHRIPPTRRNGARNPPTPRTARRPDSPTLCPAGEAVAAGPAEATACPPACGRSGAENFPATKRPVTLVAMPRIRPMVCGFISMRLEQRSTPFILLAWFGICRFPEPRRRYIPIAARSQLSTTSSLAALRPSRMQSGTPMPS